jgi:hypothetical protein
MFGRRKEYYIVFFYLKTGAMPSGAMPSGAEPSLLEEVGSKQFAVK